MMHDKLSYRRQFLLTRQPVKELNAWNMLEIGDYFLHVHPDLTVTTAGKLIPKIILLGYLYDTEDYKADNQEILNNILAISSEYKDFILALKPYVGRYAIFYQTLGSVNLVQDALALREVYYSEVENRVICGSQPNLLAHFSIPEIQKSEDEELLDFVHNHLPRVRNGRLWPGENTQYEKVKHLLPNHYLDINKLESKRYWPNTHLSKIGLEESVRKSANFLQGAMKAAAHRHPLMMAVTAGFDSRALLAASREISDSIYFFINKEDNLKDHSADIAVPKKLFRKLGIPFHVHQIPKGVPEEFKDIFLANTNCAHEMSLPVIYNIYHKHHYQKTNILGVGEIGRTKFYDEPKTITPYYLAYMLHHRRSSYAVKECNEWLAKSKIVAQEYGLNIMTLFWWEVLIGNWGAVGNSESDIAIEEFDPYASHFLYETFLSVDAKYRSFSDNILFEELIHFMWPQTLEVPCNPPDSIRGWCIWALSKFGLEYRLRYLKAKIYEFYYLKILS